MSSSGLLKVVPDRQDLYQMRSVEIKAAADDLELETFAMRTLNGHDGSLCGVLGFPLYLISSSISSSPMPAEVSQS